MNLSSTDLTRIALSIADDCFCEYYDAQEEGEIVEEKLLSFYLPEILKLLLAYGMDPNEIINDENIISEVQWVDYEDYAVKSLKVLLENGGNPNIVTDGESLFDYVAFEVSYDEYENERVVKFWLVLMAYGGCYSDGTIPLTMTEGHSVEIFRNYNDYSFTVEPIENAPPGYYGCWIMHIFDKSSGKEVARYK